MTSPGSSSCHGKLTKQVGGPSEDEMNVIHFLLRLRHTLRYFCKNINKTAKIHNKVYVAPDKRYVLKIAKEDLWLRKSKQKKSKQERTQGQKIK